MIRCCCGRVLRGCWWMRGLRWWGRWTMRRIWCGGGGFSKRGGGVWEVDNAEDLVRRVGFSKPDVAIVDIRMPPTHTDEGLRAAKQIRERYPQVGVLVLSQYVEAGYAMEL